MKEAVEQLRAVIDELAGRDPTTLDDVSLHGVAMALSQLHGRLGVVAGRALTVWEARGV